MNEHTVKLTIDKETKNTIRFEEKTEDGKPPVIGTMYIPKWVVGDTKEIEVTIKPVKKAK